jgi:uncharacterized BrkB/YihY/UPF0761 family membrane protein
MLWHKPRTHVEPQTMKGDNVYPISQPPKSEVETARYHVFVEFLKDVHNARKMAKKNHLSLLASSVAFFCIFSICPFMILCFLGSRYLLGLRALTKPSRELNTFFHTVVPANEAWVSESLTSVMRQHAFGNILSVMVLVWSTYGLFTCLTTVFSKMSVSGGQRNAFWSNIVSLLCFAFIGISSTLFFVIFTTDASTLKLLYSPVLDRFDIEQISYLASIFSIACVVSSITFIYKFMPTQKVGVGHALRGSLLFLSLFLAGRAGYQIYAHYFWLANMSIYGGFLRFIVIVIWIYYLSNSFLFSAQYAIYLEEKERNLLKKPL